MIEPLGGAYTHALKLHALMLIDFNTEGFQVKVNVTVHIDSRDLIDDNTQGMISSSLSVTAYCIDSSDQPH